MLYKPNATLIVDLVAEVLGVVEGQSWASQERVIAAKNAILARMYPEGDYLDE